METTAGRRLARPVTYHHAVLIICMTAQCGTNASFLPLTKTRQTAFSVDAVIKKKKNTAKALNPVLFQLLHFSEINRTT